MNRMMRFICGSGSDCTSSNFTFNRDWGGMRRKRRWACWIIFDDDGVGVIGIDDDVGPEAGVVADYAGALGDDGAGVVAPLAALAGQGVVEGVFVH